MSTLTRTLLHRRLLIVLALFAVLFGALPTVADVSERDGLAALAATQAGFRAVQKKVGPAVVTIYSTSRTTSPSAFNPFEDFFGVPRTPQVRSVSGSGVIIRPEGLVLTNSHVVANSTSVTVQLPGSDKKLPAKVIQSDKRTDLAVVRITEKGVYPTVELGDAKNVQAGDWAIAFGSPYGLPSTMTVGVISAIGRKLDGPDGDFNYNNLLQTDASINHGNSGGPLVNIDGEIIGINFMIYSPGEDSGSIGIGFAIPVNDYTRRVIDTLVTGHVVERGLMGVQISPLDDAKRQEFGVTTGGVFVQNVVPGKASDKAGIKDEDVIIEFNGTQVTDPDQFVNLVQQTAPGTKVPVTVIRNKKPMKLTVTLGADQPEKTVSADQEDNAVNAEKLGFSVMTLTEEIARNNNLPLSKGVVVTKVLPGSPAEEARLAPGTIIIRVGDTEISTADQFWTVLSKKMATAKFGVVMRVQQGNVTQTMTLPLPPAEDEKK